MTFSFVSCRRGEGLLMAPISRFHRLCIIGAALVTVLSSGAASIRAQGKQEIVVSAAISLKDAFEEIGALYEEQSGVRVLLNLGGSGILQKQIETGAPADLFASAGEKQMDALQRAGLIIEATRRNFARNRLVLVIPSASTLRLHSFPDLVRPEVSRLAIGNPKTVPAGQYAEQVLKNLGIWGRLENRLVPGENVRQVLDYVSRGEVSAGIVYASDALISSGRTSVAATAPEDLHAPILYPIAVVGETKSQRQARAFIDFVLSDPGQSIMKKFGFLSPR
jgi:molybdate transport system substrate-binding protein